MSKGLIQLFVGILIFIVLGWVFADIYAYVTISIVLTAILKPITRMLERLRFYGGKIPRAINILFAFTVFLSIIASFLILFIPLISEQLAVIAEMDITSLTENIGRPLYVIESFMIKNELTSKEAGFLVDSIFEQFREFISNIEMGNLLNNLISFTGSFFIGGIAVIFITFFLLYQTDKIRKWYISLISNKYFEVSIAALTKIERLLSAYLGGVSLQILTIFSIASLGLSMLGIKYALTIALFAAIANIIPYLGPILGATFGIVVGMTISPDLHTFQDYFFLVIKILSVFAVVQLSDNMFIQPIIFSKSVKAHPLEIFIVIFAGASLAGVIGMIAAIPVYTIIRVSFVEFYNGSRKYRVFKLQKVKLV